MELGNPIPKKPLFFVKTTNSYITEGQHIRVPFGCKKLHQEVELGVVFQKEAKNLRKEDVFRYVGGYAVALDMTARDFQVRLLYAASCSCFYFKDIEKPSALKSYQLCRVGSSSC